MPGRKDVFIAKRTLVCVERPEQKLFVQLAKPKRNPKYGDYSCLYRITGTGVSRSHSTTGLDSVQALQLALVSIGAEIVRIESASGLHFRFADGDDSGFPSF